MIGIYKSTGKVRKYLNPMWKNFEETKKPLFECQDTTTKQKSCKCNRSSSPQAFVRSLGRVAKILYLLPAIIKAFRKNEKFSDKYSKLVCFVHRSKPRIYKGRIDWDSYYTNVNLIRAYKKVLYQLVYIIMSVRLWNFKDGGS